MRFSFLSFKTSFKVFFLILGGGGPSRQAAESLAIIPGLERNFLLIMLYLVCILLSSFRAHIVICNFAGLDVWQAVREIYEIVPTRRWLKEENNMNKIVFIGKLHSLLF